MNESPRQYDTGGIDGATATVSADPAVSFDWCQRLTRKRAGNFYYAFRVLPTDRLRETCALYAFMRIADDLGDDESRSPEARLQGLADWRANLAAALDERRFEHPCLPALVTTMERHAIPRRYLLDVVSGVESDLSHTGFETFSELADYCYQVAGAVGISCIHVWGMTHERAIDAAIDCGLAFQLTNILRDLGEDAQMGRVYLPREDLERFGYGLDDLRAGVHNEAFRNLVRFQVERARYHYDRGMRIFDDVEPAARPILSAMIRIYRALLDEIERRDYDVFRDRIRLSRMRKTWIAVDTVLRGWWWRGRTRAGRGRSAVPNSAATAPTATTTDADSKAPPPPKG